MKDSSTMSTVGMGQGCHGRPFRHPVVDFPPVP
jgi:hypothetical protein